MIAKLSGRVDGIGEGNVVIDVGGVGYLVACAARTLARLEPGASVSLYIETQVREDAIQLFGFVDPRERAWFRMLLAVQGVGPKAALGILSIGGVDELTRAIASGDKALLTRAPGVGAKLAQRIVVELKEKVGGIPFAPAAELADLGAASPLAVGPAADALSALVNLGFRPIEASQAIAVAQARLGEAASVESLIRAGLGHLNQVEATR